MAKEVKIIQEADFNERIRKYIFWIVAFYMFVTVAGIPLILIWIAGVGQHISKKYYENLQCRLTETHLEFKKGIMFRVEKTIPLENIQDLTFLDNPFLRWFDLRILKIETAGSSNPQGSDMKLIGIINTPAFKEIVLDQRTIMRNKSLTETSQGGSTAANSQIELLTEIRDLLAEIKQNQHK
ncbi:PH domain-containing protein [Bacteroidota bacterium]